MMADMDIVEFLAARYDEAEQLARDAAAEQHPSGFPVGTAVEYGLEGIGVGEKFRLFATMWEPKDVLADITAKRKLLRRHEEDRHHPGQCSNCFNAYGEHTRWPCHVATLLAAPYADRPGYNPEWRIDD